MDKTPRFYDADRDVWLFRNPLKQSESVEVGPYSVPLDSKGWADWEDVLKAWNG